MHVEKKFCDQDIENIKNISYFIFHISKGQGVAHNLHNYNLEDDQRAVTKQKGREHTTRNIAERPTAEMKTIGKTWSEVERENSGLGFMWQKDTKRMWCVYKIISTHFLIRISRRVHLVVSSLFLPFLLVDSPTPWHTAMSLRLRSGHQTRGSAKIRQRETCLKLCWIILNFSMLALTARNVPR